MDITIHNAGMGEDTFRALTTGETGTALRKAGNDYIGGRDLSENDLYALQERDPDALSQLEADMTAHARNVCGLDKETGIALKLNLGTARRP
ncbi:hypothetical protein GCM10027040_24180 [Halomonas shantousis]